MIKYITVKKISGYELEGDVTNTINTLKQLIDEIGPDVKLDFNYEQEAYEEQNSATFYVQRPENEVERAERLAQEKIHQMRHEEWELRQYKLLKNQYELLKKKFED